MVNAEFIINKQNISNVVLAIKSKNINNIHINEDSFNYFLDTKSEVNNDLILLVQMQILFEYKVSAPKDG